MGTVDAAVDDPDDYTCAGISRQTAIELVQQKGWVGDVNGPESNPLERRSRSVANIVVPIAWWSVHVGPLQGLLGRYCAEANYAISTAVALISSAGFIIREYNHVCPAQRLASCAVHHSEGCAGRSR